MKIEQHCSPTSATPGHLKGGLTATSGYLTKAFSDSLLIQESRLILDLLISHGKQRVQRYQLSLANDVSKGQEEAGWRHEERENALQKRRELGRHDAAEAQTEAVWVLTSCREAPGAALERNCPH